MHTYVSICICIYQYPAVYLSSIYVFLYIFLYLNL